VRWWANLVVQSSWDDAGAQGVTKVLAATVHARSVATVFRQDHP
jgi:hypothetical protein